MDNTLLAYLPNELIAEANQIRQQQAGVRISNAGASLRDMIPRAPTISSQYHRYNHMLRQVYFHHHHLHYYNLHHLKND